ncbi:cobalt ABC transporter permease [Ruegeria marisrubri]|uniref:cobalt ABC transporter permease n=1 Tax=Ruegeria marisrubri TaxID=1685379 RepID=UPI001CD1BC10|nr:cobalt ABC transporter permease [Ruegeria marisrubri]MCA0908743.1 cobalt ABC transporter permease [Ruegeria marisrubri]
MKHLVVILAMCCAPVPALAHKVIAGVFESGDVIEGEIGFSNGDMASGTEVIVTGPDGAELGRSVTDTDGFFVYTPTSAVAHTFFADLGAGHVAEVTMSAEDVARIMGVAVAENGDSSSAAVTQASGSVASLSAEEQQVIAKAVRDELRPLRREIAAYREQNDLQTILGGIGYIVGLFGLGFYMAARRKLAS